MCVYIDSTSIDPYNKRLVRFFFLLATIHIYALVCMRVGHTRARTHTPGPYVVGTPSSIFKNTRGFFPETDYND